MASDHHYRDIVRLLQNAHSNKWIFTQLLKWRPNESLQTDR